MYEIYKDGILVIQGTDFEVIKKIAEKMHPDSTMVWEGPDKKCPWRRTGGFLGKVSFLGC
jgi:hypothetical protein